VLKGVDYKNWKCTHHAVVKNTTDIFARKI